MIEVRLWSYLAALSFALLISIICISYFSNVKKIIYKNRNHSADMGVTISQRIDFLSKTIEKKHIIRMLVSSFLLFVILTYAALSEESNTVLISIIYLSASVLSFVGFCVVAAIGIKQARKEK